MEEDDNDDDDDDDDIMKHSNKRKYTRNKRFEIFTEAWLRTPLCELTAASLATPLIQCFRIQT